MLKLIAGNLDSEGQYKEVLNQNGTAPPAGPHLVVSDAWSRSPGLARSIIFSKTSNAYRRSSKMAARFMKGRSRS